MYQHDARPARFTDHNIEAFKFDALTFGGQITQGLHYQSTDGIQLGLVDIDTECVFHCDDG